MEFSSIYSNIKEISPFNICNDFFDETIQQNYCITVSELDRQLLIAKIVSAGFNHLPLIKTG